MKHHNISTNIEREPVIELRREEVARRTLQLWQAAGQPAGRDLEFWLQAEVELLSRHRHPNRGRAAVGL